MEKNRIIVDSFNIILSDNNPLFLEIDSNTKINVTVNENSLIDNSIIGWNSIIGKWVRIEGLSVFGEFVTIKDEVLINKNFILPNVTITGKKHSIGGPLVEAAMNEYASGGKIHIKPENKGK